MPRGVTSATARTDLLDATVRRLEVGGYESLTVRAIAADAGVATGLLYQYFDDRDGLLVAVVLDRFKAQADEGGALVQRAGTRTVKENLTAFGQTAVAAASLPLVRLLNRRPDLAERARRALGSSHTPGIEEIERAVADYLGREQSFGRVHPAISASTAALLLVSGWHRVLLQDPDTPSDRHEQIETLVDTLLTGLEVVTG